MHLCYWRAKKAHKLFSHKLSVRPFLPGIVPGTNWVCPRDKPGFAGLPLCKIRRKPVFVPGFHRVCTRESRWNPRDKPGVVPRPTGQKKLYLCAFFLPEFACLGQKIDVGPAAQKLSTKGFWVSLGQCPSAVPLVFPVLVFQLSKQQNRTRTTSSTVLRTPPNRTRTEKFPLEELEAVALLVGFSTGNPLKIATFRAPRTAHETALGHLLIHGAGKISTPNMTGRRSHCTMEMIPALPWYSKSPYVSIPIKQSTKQGDARGAREVRQGTSSIHFHCPAPRSSSHIGHGRQKTRPKVGKLAQKRGFGPFPKGPKIEIIQDLENFKRDWKFQASHPPNPLFLCGEFWRSGLKISSEIENFKRDWKFQSRLNFFNLSALRVFRFWGRWGKTGEPNQTSGNSWKGSSMT